MNESIPAHERRNQMRRTLSSARDSMATSGHELSHTPKLSHDTVQRTRQARSQLAPQEVMAWQRSVGNQAVVAMLGRGATSLNGVTSMVADAGATVQRAAVSPRVGAEGGALDDEVEGRLRQAQSAGSSLPQAVRGALEPGLGADLSNVKVHTDSRAVQLAREMGAKAFTHKNHIYYGAGHAPSDLKLTAHEAVHTIQQGAVQQHAQRKPEGAVSRMATPTISRVPATIQRFNLLDKLRRRRRPMTDEDVVSQTTGDGGSLNRVDKMKYRRRIGGSKSKTGFFKPNEKDQWGEDENMSKRAVGSSVLDKWLGTNILAEEVFAKHQGESGSVSAMVKGSPLQEVIFNTPLDPNSFDPSQADPTQHKQINGQWFGVTDVRQKYHDYSNPRTQKGLSDLQLLDAITGQIDRHGGNIFLDDKTGTVKGIDNDQAFHLGLNYINDRTDRYHGLPSQVDKRTARRILKRKAKNLPKVLGPDMDPNDVKNAQERMREVKRHLKQLKKDKKLVNKWDDTTYLRALGESDQQGSFGKMYAPNMLKRIVNNYLTATDREEPEDETFFMGESPLYSGPEVESEEEEND